MQLRKQSAKALRKAGISNICQRGRFVCRHIVITVCSEDPRPIVIPTSKEEKKDNDFTVCLADSLADFARAKCSRLFWPLIITNQRDSTHSNPSIIRGFFFDCLWRQGRHILNDKIGWPARAYQRSDRCCARRLREFAKVWKERYSRVNYARKSWVGAKVSIERDKGLQLACRITRESSET